jgi:hypothetical protein
MIFQVGQAISATFQIGGLRFAHLHGLFAMPTSSSDFAVKPCRDFCGRLLVLGGNPLIGCLLCRDQITRVSGDHRQHENQRP